MPIFGQSCAFSTCHGSTTGPANGVFLGKDPARVYAAINGVHGDELQTMPFVTPGDPRQSYLMRKMDGSQCALDAQCTGGTCQGVDAQEREPPRPGDARHRPPLDRTRREERLTSRIVRR